MEEKVTFLIFKELKSLAQKVEELEERADLVLELKREIKEIREQNGELKKELKRKSEEWARKEKEWEDQKERSKGNSEKIERLEVTEEKRDRKERRNNIIIAGEFEEEKVRDGRELTEVILRHIGVDDDEVVEPVEVIVLKNNKTVTDGQTRILVKLKDMKDKLKVMRNKFKLKGRDVYIDDDLCKTDRQIQAEIRQWAKLERLKGNLVRIGYKKLKINGIWEKYKSGNIDNEKVKTK